MTLLSIRNVLFIGRRVPALEEGHVENGCEGIHGLEEEGLEDQPLLKLGLSLREL